jgi:putative oxidoreductase
MNHDPILLVGRILASSIFILSGYGKATAMAGTIAYLGKLGVPAPDITYFGVVAIELGGGLLMLLGFQTRIVALVLALFCVATGLLAHTDFADRGQLINFQKNICMAGGFLAFVAAGAGAFSLDGAMGRRRALA